MNSPLRVIFALLAIAFTSCATRGGGGADNQLVGKWRSSRGSQTAEYRFGKDGTFSGSVTSRGALVSDFTGRWSLRQGIIIYNYTGDRLRAIPVGTVDRDKLLSIAKESYVIEAADGSQRRYVRIAD